jgi:antitoxin MazE
MRTRIVRIGNSQGIRLPRPLLEQAGLGEDVVLRVAPGRIVIEAARTPRQGWEEEAKAMHQAGEDVLLDHPAPTEFDRTEWEW